MATPQPGIFAFGTRVHHYLELDVDPAAEPAAICEAIGALLDTSVTTGGTNVVIAFGADLWRRLAPDDAPASLASAQPIAGSAGHHAPATQHDVWVWITGGTSDVVVDAARAAVALLAPVASLAVEQDGFTYLDSRDYTGFIDGTENPPLHEAVAAACVPEGLPGAGGSHLLTMRWVHDLAAFHALSVPEQEAVFGRTKPDSIELADDVKPADAHISRVVVEDEAGDELEIYRRSTPFGSAGEQGLSFVAFSTDIERVDRMLARMYGQDADGIHDHLLDFTRATHHARWFCPSLDTLARTCVHFSTHL